MRISHLRAIWGYALILIGLALFSLTFFTSFGSDRPINDSLVLQPDAKHSAVLNRDLRNREDLFGPWTQSNLKGKISINQRGKINLTTIAYNAGLPVQNLNNVTINSTFNFTIDQADDLYIFHITNVGGVATPLNFTVDETHIKFLQLDVSLIILVLTLPAGIFVLVRSNRAKRMNSNIISKTTSQLIKTSRKN